MKIAIIVILSLVGVVALVVGIIALIGSSLPVTHVATRSIVLHRQASEIYKVVRDVRNAPTWRSDLKSVELLGDVNGKLTYKEHGSQGDVTYELTEDVPDQKVVTRIPEQGLGYSGTWTTTITPEDDGTRVAITENGEVSNVLFRFMSRYIFGHTSTIDGYLTSLA
jgi:uncharacterized membrane protein